MTRINEMRWEKKAIPYPYETIRKEYKFLELTFRSAMIFFRTKDIEIRFSKDSIDELNETVIFFIHKTEKYIN